MISVAKYLSPLKNTNTNRKIASAPIMESKAVGLKILTTKTNNHSLILLQRNQIIPSTSSSFSSSYCYYNYSHHHPAAETCFLKTCFLCHKHLSPNKDIYMYRGDQGFCSEECRSRQIYIDDVKQLEISTAKKMIHLHFRSRRCNHPHLSHRSSRQTSSMPTPVFS